MIKGKKLLKILKKTSPLSPQKEIKIYTLKNRISLRIRSMIFGAL